MDKESTKQSLSVMDLRIADINKLVLSGIQALLEYLQMAAAYEL